MPETQLSQPYVLASSGLVLRKEESNDSSFFYTIAGTDFYHRESGPDTVECSSGGIKKFYFDVFIMPHAARAAGCPFENFQDAVPMHFLAEWKLKYDYGNYDFISELHNSILNYFIAFKNRKYLEPVLDALKALSEEYKTEILEYHKKIIANCYEEGEHNVLVHKYSVKFNETFNRLSLLTCQKHN